jgi:DNA-binding response OmpR family regulator
MPVIVMTGRGELAGLMEGIAVDGFVNKPFEMHLVLGAVKKVLECKKKTVYLADSEGSVTAQAIAKELRDERYQVFFIKGVKGFAEYWAKQPADYVVMEYEQHSVSGGELIRAIRSCAPKISLMVYTYSGMDFREKSLAEGASIYLGKPKDPAEVVTAIREFEMK